jgi:hypothetical protein
MSSFLSTHVKNANELQSSDTSVGIQTRSVFVRPSNRNAFSMKIVCITHSTA